MWILLLLVNNSFNERGKENPLPLGSVYCISLTQTAWTIRPSSSLDSLTLFRFILTYAPSPIPYMKIWMHSWLTCLVKCEKKRVCAKSIHLWILRVLQDGSFQQEHSVLQVSLSWLPLSLFECVRQVFIRIICVEVVALSAKKKKIDSGNVSFSLFRIQMQTRASVLCSCTLGAKLEQQESIFSTEHQTPRLSSPGFVRSL